MPCPRFSGRQSGSFENSVHNHCEPLDVVPGLDPARAKESGGEAESPSPQRGEAPLVLSLAA
jgi:hypothetical protein